MVALCWRRVRRAIANNIMHTPTVRKLDDAIAKMEGDLQKLKDEREAFVSMPLNERLAIEIHSALCHWNHTDGCGWFYEIKDGKHDWSRNAHKRSLNSANAVLGKIKQLGIESDMAIPRLMIFASNKG